ncbi:MAG TPA: hemerythrin domain-containing protein [Telluria sp.]|nr:hemerythrin domain-containing protein [Telluria sp.]
MARTDTFRKHHDEILGIAREINGQLGSTIDDNTAEAIRKLMARLNGLVTLHLAMEDKALYPALLAHSDASVKDTARRFSDEMGSVAEAFVGYMKSWSTSAQIKANPVGFTTESKAIFNALSKRIHRENVELYVLLDAVEA